MASVESHINQWKHNREFLALIPALYSDWQMTVIFYVAVHAVDTLLAFDKIFPTSHEFRNGVLYRTNRYAEIRKSYGPMYNLARDIRYLADPKSWLPPEKIQAEVVMRHLYPIEKSVQKLTGKDLALPLITLLPTAPSN
jgi:hypothetical protein